MLIVETACESAMASNTRSARWQLVQRHSVRHRGRKSGLIDPRRRAGYRAAACNNLFTVVRIVIAAVRPNFLRRGTCPDQRTTGSRRQVPSGA